MYMAHPFPQWTPAERRRRLAAELGRYRFLGLERAMPGARFLDVGCGTGNRSMLPAKHLGVKRFVGLDRSSASLAIARRVAEEESFERFEPVRGNLLDLPFADGSFDVVVSWGVLHHTPDPRGGLREMVRVCRDGGHVALFLYNKFNHWRHNLQKARVSRLAGSDVEERFRVAHRLYGRKPIEEMSPEEVAVFYDQYCHPYKSDHTIGETLRWLDELGLEYAGSYPPLRIRDALAALQHRGTLLAEHPVRDPVLRRLIALARRLPAVDARERYERPGALHRAFWQAVWAWQGRSGAYSGGAALAARVVRPQPASSHSFRAAAVERRASSALRSSTDS
jgi:ubiquinone/menaquinone biosynthesis C-methylase UbiE